MEKSNVSGYPHQTLPDKETKLRAIRCQNEDFKKKNEMDKIQKRLWQYDVKQDKICKMPIKD